MKVSINWQGNIAMQAQTASGHSINLDGPEELGGENSGARPMEMLLVGLGGCTLVDVISILHKMGQKFNYCSINISAKRASSHPKVFTDIDLFFSFKGVGLSLSKVKKAIDLSANKYCSVAMMLNKTATISHNFEINNG